MKHRWFHKRYAQANGYFWLPCPLCKKKFGGHEWKRYNGLPDSVPIEGQPGMGRGICPDCTRAGKGKEIFA